MKKALVILIVALMTVMSSALHVIASEPIILTGGQRFTLNEEVEIPGVCVFNIISIDVEPADDGWQQMEFTLHFQNMSPHIIDLGEFMQWELSYWERFTFELVNTEDFEDNFFRPLVGRNVNLTFLLPNAALVGDYDDLILSLSFDGSPAFRLDVLDALGLAEDGAVTMVTPTIILDRARPLLPPEVWMDIGDFALRIDGVRSYENIEGMPAQVDNAERFLVVSMIVRNLTLTERSVADAEDVELIFREVFTYELFDFFTTRESLMPLEDATFYMIFQAPNLLFDADDEELWVFFNVNGTDLATEVREFMEDGGETFTYSADWNDVHDDTGTTMEKVEQDLENVTILGRDIMPFRLELAQGFTRSSPGIMMAAEYVYGFTTSGEASLGGNAFYNIGGQYTSMSGIFGPLDGTAKSSATVTLTIEGDGRILETFETGSWQPIMPFTVDVTGVTAITFRFSWPYLHGTWGTRSEYHFGVANVILSTTDNAPVQFNTPAGTFNDTAVLGRDIQAYRLVVAQEFASNRTGSMMGVAREYGFRTTGESSLRGYASYNLNGQYTTMTGVFGPLDDTAISNASVTLRIIGDGNILETIETTAGSPATSFTVDVTGIRSVRFHISWPFLHGTWGERSGYHFGVADVTVTR